MASPTSSQGTRTRKTFFSWDKYRSQKVNLLPILLFIVGVIFSGVGAWRLYNEIERNAQAEFQRDAERISGEIVRRFSQPVYGLNGAKGAYATNNHLNREQFRAYVASHDLSVEFPGVRGFGFIQHVQRNHLDTFLAEVRADGAPTFTLHQLDDKHYDDLYIVKYLVPTENNQGAEGLDVGSESVRRAAISMAINTGRATLSDTINLVQDDRKTPGVLLFVPVYAYGANPTTPAERQAALVGVLYAPIVIADLLRNIPEFINGSVDIELFDSTRDLSTQHLVFNADDTKTPNFVPKEEHSAQVIKSRIFSQVTTLLLPGREMTLRVTSTHSFEALTERYAAWLLFAFGFVLSSALALLLRQQISGRHRAEMLARNMTADLERLALVAKNIYERHPVCQALYLMTGRTIAAIYPVFMQLRKQLLTLMKSADPRLNYFCEPGVRYFFQAW